MVCWWFTLMLAGNSLLFTFQMHRASHIPYSQVNQSKGFVPMLIKPLNNHDKKRIKSWPNHYCIFMFKHTHTPFFTICSGQLRLINCNAEPPLCPQWRKINHWEVLLHPLSSEQGAQWSKCDWNAISLKSSRFYITAIWCKVNSSAPKGAEWATNNANRPSLTIRNSPRNWKHSQKKSEFLLWNSVSL